MNDPNPLGKVPIAPEESVQPTLKSDTGEQCFLNDQFDFALEGFRQSRSDFEEAKKAREEAKYPSRSRTHVLEEESNRAFLNLIPSEWTKNQPTNDYGIDWDVEVMVDGKAKAKLLGIQLKATDKHQIDKLNDLSAEAEKHKKVPDDISFSMEVKNLNYYRQYPYPVVILRYIARRDMPKGGVFFILFAQRYIEEHLETRGLFRGKLWHEQEKVNLYFNEKCDSPASLEEIAFDGPAYLQGSALNQRFGSDGVYLEGGELRSDQGQLAIKLEEAKELAKNGDVTGAKEKLSTIVFMLTISDEQRVTLYPLLHTCAVRTEDEYLARHLIMALRHIVSKNPGLANERITNLLAEAEDSTK